MTSTTTEIRIATYYLDDQNIIRCKWKETDPFPSYKDCVEMVNTELIYANNSPYVVLTDLRDVFGTIDDESKKLFATHEEINRLKIAEAILVNTLAIKLMVNSYIILFKPMKPTKVFKDEQKAIDWLNKMRQDAEELNI